MDLHLMGAICNWGYFSLANEWPARQCEPFNHDRNNVSTYSLTYGEAPSSVRSFQAHQAIKDRDSRKAQWSISCERGGGIRKREYPPL